MVSVLDALGAGLLIVSGDLQVEYANPAADQILGRSLTGDSLDSLLDDSAHAFGMDVRRAIRAGIPIDRGEVTILNEDTRERVIGYSVHPRAEGEGGGTVLCKDITAIKELQSLLDESETFALIAEAAGAIAHEIRNPLAIVTAYLDLIGESVATDDEARSLMGRVYAESERITRVLQAFQEFASGAPTRRVRIRPEELCRQAIDIVAADDVEMPSIRFETEDSGPVWVGPDAMRRAIVNLLRNAREAMKEGGEIAIRISSTSTNAQIRIADTGTGIPNEIRQKVFRPFFTTRAGHTGLGLAVVRRVVEQHEGRLELHSGEQQGTTVVIELPLASQVGSIRTDD
ncbi:MAG: hypothetical protein CME06_01430 [Gemmatimonadetes bacterium]|nr:hypothetical protein [Gemmatimonadota bacterium]